MSFSEEVSTGLKERCPFCFFGMIIYGQCTRCDGQEAIRRKEKEIITNRTALIQSRALAYTSRFRLFNQQKGRMNR